MHELSDELDEDIVAAERRLAFWQEQENLQAGTELIEHVREILAGYENQLRALYPPAKHWRPSALLASSAPYFHSLG